MGKDDQSAGERRRTLARRPFLGAMVAAGLAGCGGDDESTDTPAESPTDRTDEPTEDPSTPENHSWPSIDDPYFANLAAWLERMDIPPGEFAYGASESATAEAYAVEGEPGTTSDLEVGSEVPFSHATRVEVTEAPADPWVVTMKGTVEDRDVAEGDVLLGVAALRGPESSETDPIVNYAVKDEDNESSNMVRGQSEVTLDAEWQRYAFPITFDYDSEAGTWWTEFFLGDDVQTVDVGGLALFDFGTDIAASDLPSGAVDAGGSGDGPDDGDWESRADARIEEHRTADLTVDVTDADGNPVEAAEVDVAMTDHEFGFGTAINADHLINETSEGDVYREHVRDLFNTVVMENHHKWRFWEEAQELADAATGWANDRGMTVRGHVCLWANVEGWAVPDDVVRAMGVEWSDGGVEDPELDPDHVRQRSFDHVTEIVEHYGEDVAEWEVVNEVTHQPGLIKAVDGVPATEDEELEDVDPVEAPVLAEWYATAREAVPEGTPIGVNDYNTLAGPNPSTRQQYESQIDFLAGQDAGLDFAGLQSHFQESSSLTPTEVKAALDAYAEHDVRLRITEFDMADEGWDEADKATFFHDFLKVAFSHPAVDDFLVWGINSGMHWRDDAPFFTTDWERKPALEEYESLVFDEWWTEEEGTTDAEGTYATTGFRGEYEVTATIDGDEVTTTATLGDGGATVELSPE